MAANSSNNGWGTNGHRANFVNAMLRVRAATSHTCEWVYCWPKPRQEHNELLESEVHAPAWISSSSSVNGSTKEFSIITHSKCKIWPHEEVWIYIRWLERLTARRRLNDENDLNAVFGTVFARIFRGIYRYDKCNNSHWSTKWVYSCVCCGKICHRTLEDIVYTRQWCAMYIAGASMVRRLLQIFEWKINGWRAHANYHTLTSRSPPSLSQCHG